MIFYEVITDWLLCWHILKGEEFMIKAFWLGLAIGFLLFTVAGAYGGYVLELENGGEILVSDYWEVEDEIRYARYGGVVGVPVSEVQRIRLSDEESPAREGLSSRSEGFVPAEPQPSPKVEALPASESKVKGNPEEQQYMKDFQALKSRSGNLASMTRQDLQAFSNDLEAFRNKVLSSGQGHIYNPQLLEVYDMLDRVEQAYHQRYQ